MKKKLSARRDGKKVNFSSHKYMKKGQSITNNCLGQLVEKSVASYNIYWQILLDNFFNFKE